MTLMLDWDFGAFLKDCIGLTTEWENWLFGPEKVLHFMEIGMIPDIISEI